MTEVDERDFLKFLRESAHVQLFETFSPTEAGLWVDAFAPTRPGHWQYRIWNKAFPFTPDVRQTTREAGSRAGLYYMANTHDTPLLEYDRHNFESSGGYGRLYWSKYFSAPSGLTYDVEKFGRWYESIVGWIRKNGRRKTRGTLEPYYLPDAWAKHGVS